jgi:3-oxoacyl-[acyl-carrier protein] reductase
MEVNFMDEKRVAIVTGGTRGMGRSISEHLAKAGNIVAAVYHSDEGAAKKTGTLLKNISPESEVFRADLSKAAEAGRLVGEVGAKYGRIDILVNNAGIFDFNFIEDMTEEYLDRVINTNFKSQFFMLQAVIPYMKKNHYGRIANASSISGRFADVGLTAYAASKAAVNLMTGIASAELAPYGITVNAYAPGIIHTDMTDAMIKERGEIQARQISSHRFGTGDDAAALVAFLVSPEAGYVTGEIIGVDGGFFKVQNPDRAYEYAKKQPASLS